VFFRAANFDAAVAILHAMTGANGLGIFAPSNGHSAALLVVAGLLLIAWLAPNTQELVRYCGPNASENDPALTERRPQMPWQPTLRWAVFIGCATGISLMSLSKVSEFLYFQF
jgi:hypothetical protein